MDIKAEPETVLGCDFSGTVVKLGNAITAQVKVGDHVAGFVQGGKSYTSSWLWADLSELN